MAQTSLHNFRYDSPQPTPVAHVIDPVLAGISSMHAALTRAADPFGEEVLRSDIDPQVQGSK